jgi:hypothetical protein
MVMEFADNAIMGLFFTHCRQCHHGFVFYPKSDEERIALIEANVYGKGNQHYDPRKVVLSN